MPKKTSKLAVYFQLSHNQKQALDNIAKTEHVTIAGFLRCLIDSYIQIKAETK